MTSEIPDELIQFLHSRVENIDRLRVLLLMHKEPARWTVEALSARLYVPPHKLKEDLQSLLYQGFIRSESEDTFSYIEDCPYRGSVEALAQLDEKKPVTLIKIVYQSPLKMFSDAFKLKKKDS